MTADANDQKNRNVLIAILLTVLLFFGCICCFIAASFGSTSMSFLGASKMLEVFAEMDKSYYPECQALTDSDMCKECCDDRGHIGMTFGHSMNTDGHSCGCVGSPPRE